MIDVYAALAVCAFGFVGTASAQETMIDSDGQRAITVSGQGRVKAVPDMVEIRVGVSRQATNARDTLGTVNKTM